MKLVKSDKLIGGLHQGTNLLPVYTLSLDVGKDIKYNITVDEGANYILEFNVTAAGTNKLTIFTGHITMEVSVKAGYNSFKVRRDAGAEALTITNTTGAKFTVDNMRLYPGEEPSVDLIPLHAQMAKETKEANLNNWFIEVDLPLLYKDDIKQGYIIYTDTKSKKDQPFRIHNIEITKRRIRVVANHVIFDTRDYIVLDANTEGKPVAGALSILNSSLDRPSPYKVSSTVELPVDQDFNMISYYEAIMHIVDLLGLYVDIDGFQFVIREEMGEVKGVLEYGDNLQDIKVYENWDGVVTKIFPIGPDGLTLPEKSLTGSVLYDEVYSKVVEFESELELDDEDEEGNPIDNTALLVSELRDNAQMYLERNQVPKVAYIISSDVPQELNVFDYVQVKHPAITNNIPGGLGYENLEEYNYFITVQVTKYEYNILSKITEKLEYGEFTSTLKSILNKVEKEIDDKMGDKLIDQEQQLKDQTDKINNWNKNGHVIQLENEILVVDTLPKENAKDVLKIGIGGIGFSNTGIDGVFTSAWGLNSQFNADFITAGTLEGSLLRVGSIESEHLSVEAIDMIVSLSKTGGTNIIKNSVGLGGIKPPWYVSSSLGSWDTTRTTWSLQSVAKNALTNTIPTARMYQDVELQPNQIHTLSAKVNKTVNGVASITLDYYASETRTTSVKSYKWSKNTGETETGSITIRMPHEPYRYARLTLETSESPDLQVSDLVLVEGNGTYWSQAPGEIYGSDVTFDADGIKVARRSEAGDIIGYTIMSPQEFAGYYNDEKIFTLNEDITEVMGLEVKGKGLFIRPVKMVQNTSGGGSLDIVWTGKG